MAKHKPESQIRPGQAAQNYLIGLPVTEDGPDYEDGEGVPLDPGLDTSFLERNRIQAQKRAAKFGKPVRTEMAPKVRKDEAEKEVLRVSKTAKHQGGAVLFHSEDIDE